MWRRDCAGGASVVPWPGRKGGTLSRTDLDPQQTDLRWVGLDGGFAEARTMADVARTVAEIRRWWMCGSLDDGARAPDLRHRGARPVVSFAKAARGGCRLGEAVRGSRSRCYGGPRRLGFFLSLFLVVDGMMMVVLTTVVWQWFGYGCWNVRVSLSTQTW
ncbi:basic proline-rich protein-like [Iris pallida]|uniref:Basic proline-rich protein-like n=1 Tax=Iris pallida TaxID=29817 RepID=A0AAX6HA80_IRIPA|nr:basic proline-rich protein-like [Iris pallida]